MSTDVACAAPPIAAAASAAARTSVGRSRLMRRSSNEKEAAGARGRRPSLYALLVHGGGVERAALRDRRRRAGVPLGDNRRVVAAQLADDGAVAAAGLGDAGVVIADRRSRLGAVVVGEALLDAGALRADLRRVGLVTRAVLPHRRVARADAFLVDRRDVVRAVLEHHAVRVVGAGALRDRAGVVVAAGTIALRHVGEI